MDSKRRTTRGRNRRPLKTTTTRRPRRALASRRPRRQGVGYNRRNRLARAVGRLRRNRQGGLFRRRPRFFRRNVRNLRLRKLFVGGLPKFVDNRRLYGLFRREGAIVGCRIIYDRMGISRGFGEVEFRYPRDAWRCIQKWNNTTYDRNTLRIEYRRKKRRNNNRRGFGGNYQGGRDYRRDYRSGYNDRNRNFRGNYQNRGFRGSFGGRFRGRNGY